MHCVEITTTSIQKRRSARSVLFWWSKVLMCFVWMRSYTYKMYVKNESALNTSWCAAFTHFIVSVSVVHASHIMRSYRSATVDAAKFFKWSLLFFVWNVFLQLKYFMTGIMNHTINLFNRCQYLLELRMNLLIEDIHEFLQFFKKNSQH